MRKDTRSSYETSATARRWRLTAAPLKRFERLLVSRWIVRHVATRLLRVDETRCSRCNQCLRQNPKGTVSWDQRGRLVWGRDCLLCLFCEMKCPGVAITSPHSCRHLRLLVRLNVRYAARDASLDFVRVIHEHVQTRGLSPSSQCILGLQRPTGVTHPAGCTLSLSPSISPRPAATGQVVGGRFSRPGLTTPSVLGRYRSAARPPTERRLSSSGTRRMRCPARNCSSQAWAPPIRGPWRRGRHRRPPSRRGR